ncbi:hypothetical protein Acr_17g0008230 [Actinidia rufa]|uniref:Uncharacterized protein n=1 Tax=Actinidia rufa TaxID=165716 RepID=A0A7J0G398_9ERIC|nr:hypothetical protein Acr_17g0008230 [Actinidia rufa]
MGRQSSCHPTMVGSSSIALLQERFRQLERVRERREKQEHRTLFEPGKSSFQQHKMIFPLFPPPQDHHELSLGLEPPLGKLGDFRAIKTGTLPNSRSTDATLMGNINKIENSEVDTSLHL